MPNYCTFSPYSFIKLFCADNSLGASNDVPPFFTNCTHVSYYIHYSFSKEIKVQEDSKLPFFSLTRAHFYYKHSFMWASVLNRIQTLVKMHLAVGCRIVWARDFCLQFRSPEKELTIALKTF